MARWALILGIAGGFLAVLLGAFGAHALKPQLTAKGITLWQLASDYQFYHSLALIGLGIWLERKTPQHLDAFSVYAFVVGVLLFSGSLYCLALLKMSWLAWFTPLGGTCLILAWGAWLISAWHKKTG